MLQHKRRRGVFPGAVSDGDKRMIDILTALLVVITGFYAWVTFRILRANEAVVQAMRDQLEAQSRPYVHPSLFIVPGTNIFGLRVKNTGKTAASNLRLSIDKDFFLLAKKEDAQNLRKMNAFSKPIASFPPDAEIEFWVAQSPHIFDADADQAIVPHVFTVQSDYDFFEKSVSEKTTLDFHPFLNTNIPHSEVVNELAKIRKLLEKWNPTIKK
jgi:hypothetical protein